MNDKLKAVTAALLIFATLGTGASAATSSFKPHENCPSCQSEKFKGSHALLLKLRFGHSMNALSRITGKAESELIRQYPQKTSWQIAFELGKLDQLKKAVLEEHKQGLDKAVADKKITEEESKKIYADLQKRIALIDGKNIVILGRPGFCF